MQYRRTPNSTGYSPSELLNSRQIRTKIDILLPIPAYIAQDKQAKEATRSQTQEVAYIVTNYKVGDTVYALYFGPRRDKDPRWVPAVVTKRKGTRTVLLGADMWINCNHDIHPLRTWNRVMMSRQQIKRTSEQNLQQQILSKQQLLLPFLQHLHLNCDVPHALQKEYHHFVTRLRDSASRLDVCYLDYVDCSPLHCTAVSDGSCCAAPGGDRRSSPTEDQYSGSSRKKSGELNGPEGVGEHEIDKMAF
ncbi:hypothetical protein CAPTEDRAFT_211866 [Capitella teleta]|uniref:Uncharacterized protein n=1 Tax=Capitella teleta TaxID=283909 RepID=R7UXR7_CAPTE|nr:hypothetical protein CAPTEDRAFT_211866 [Capitella teleta]|eukprot:ELU11373.1 hypothetical protein CAPTEDRAFT_211866 [Capitella teleta]